MNEELRNEVARVLAHEYGCKPGMIHEGYGTACASNAHAPALYRTFGCDHVAHLADALMPLLERRERETAALAWNEGHRAGIEYQRTDGQFIRFVETNPYRADASTEETA